jgi:hypothetical protein
MGDESRNVRVKVNTGGSMGLVWFMGWLFSIGFLHLTLPRALYAIVVWPYYLGRFFAH